MSGNPGVRGRRTTNPSLVDPAGWLSSPAILYPASLLHSGEALRKRITRSPSPLTGTTRGLEGSGRFHQPLPQGRKGVQPSRGKCGADLSLKTSEAPSKSRAEVSGAGWWSREGQPGAKLGASARLGIPHGLVHGTFYLLPLPLWPTLLCLLP